MRAMVGAMVIGPTKRVMRPTRPDQPTAISTTEPKITAPWICAIFTSKPASLTPTMPQIAIAGVKKLKVPPWMIGSRLPHVACSKVAMPDTKNMVPISAPSCTGSSAMPSGPAMMSGIATVEPNIVR
jgi:hypothetical protein